MLDQGVAEELAFQPDKYVPASEAVVRLEAGQIWFPELAPRRADFEAELLQFTVAGSHAHDD